MIPLGCPKRKNRVRMSLTKLTLLFGRQEAKPVYEAREMQVTRKLLRFLGCPFESDILFTRWNLLGAVGTRKRPVAD